MRVCLAFGVVAAWLCAPTAAAASACQHFQQTGGCDPNGPREGRVSCDTEVPHGSSGFCDCGAGAVNWEVSCDHPAFTCRDACFVAGLKRAHEQATGDADPARPFGDCLWRQTGGCTPTGRREPQADKACDAWVERGASGYCLCADARRDAKSTCSHAPFRCRDECAPASSSGTAAAIADAEDDALFDSLRGTVWQLDSGQRATMEGSGKWDAPECQTATHVECLWNVNHGRVVIEWGRRGVFVAQPQQSVGADAGAGADVGGVGDPTPSALVGESVTGPRATFAATLLERIGSGDYYSVLGVSDDAGKSDIKRAYRRLSVVYHPDKNSDAAAAAKFDAVRVAYEVLSNDDKRRVYDTGGEEAVQRFEQGQVRRTSDSKASLGITLAQVYTGATVQVSAKRRIVCRGCANRRSAACKMCGDCPKEVRTVKRRMGPFMMNQQEQVPSKERCREDAVKLDVVVEQGVAQGHQVRFDGKGEQRPGEIPGNMVLTLNIKHVPPAPAKHHIFERQGKHDLRMTQRLSLKEALLGFAKSVEHLDGHTVPLVRSGITKVGDVMRVHGEGMPHHNMASQHGDLLVSLAIDVPDALTPEQRDAIQRLF